MKKFKYILLIFLGIVGLSSCDDFGSLNENPNTTDKEDTKFLFTHACKYTQYFVMVGTYDPWNQIYPQYFSERQNIQFTNFSLSDFNLTPYYTHMLRNLKGIIDLNENPDTKDLVYVIGLGSSENQIAASRTLRAYAYMHMTDVLGMVPYFEALEGEKENFTPKYDTQEDIYADLDKDLKEAYDQFNESGKLNSTYDILYNGDIGKWKKFNASIRMMLAIKLADVAPSVGKERFSIAFKDGGIATNEESLVYRFLPESANQNPMYNNIIVTGRKDFAPSKTIIDQLLAFKDPRIKAYATPNSDGEYVGMPFGINQNEIEKYKDVSQFHERYYQQDSPFIVTSAAHILLIQAEAVARGWITADIEDLYKKGIQASFDLYPEIASEVNLDEYIAQDGVKLPADMEGKIECIGMQRWLSNFMQDGIEAWSDWRRLDVPKIKPGPSA
uniref:SusD/RagB family nutrient-binding outer membrane lipoprotein n=1 Tax=Bacteroides sp. TaxID=29523 RepID=UPI002587B739